VIVLHQDETLFRDALAFTERETSFAARLVEKDYFCTVLLEYLAIQAGTGLVFKGGTCLAKIHADFYRLSEDLDFAISMPVDAPRRKRSAKAPQRKISGTRCRRRFPAFELPFGYMARTIQPSNSCPDLLLRHRSRATSENVMSRTRVYPNG
jgi:predicted nucleotidyltransferase component of viral defense system